MPTRVWLGVLVAIATTTCAVAGGCSSRQGIRDAGARDTGGSADTGAVDAAMVDGGIFARPDMGPADTGVAPRDAGHDAGRDTGVDAGRDAATVPDAGHDAAISDTGVDAATVDAFMDDTGPFSGRHLECVPVVRPNELNSGQVLSAMFWVGFRFEITSATSLVAIGLDVNGDTASGGTLIGGVVALTDSSDAPDTPNFTGGDVVATTLVTVPPASGSVIARAPLTAPLPAGWYAVVFGTGAMGATLSGGTVHSNSGDRGCTLPGSSYPFSIRQSDGSLILQGSTPNIFVDVDP